MYLSDGINKHSTFSCKKKKKKKLIFELGKKMIFELILVLKIFNASVGKIFQIWLSYVYLGIIYMYKAVPVDARRG